MNDLWDELVLHKNNGEEVLLDAFWHKLDLKMKQYLCWAEACRKIKLSRSKS